MYGVLGEDKSDVATLKVLIQRLAREENVSIKTKGYNGCGEMLTKGGKQLKLFAKLGCNRFIVCYDADDDERENRYQEVVKRIIKKSGLTGLKTEEIICIVIPVQEIEAWILADIEAVTHIFQNWHPKPISNPESIDSPKEYLEKISRDSKKRLRYNHATHNEKVAQYLDLEKVFKKCPSFNPLKELVESDFGNYPPNR
ncbi:hypothetical protein BGS_0398 [Beggiatoa sp. SS]|nr:hypothetical protein BGS_0398 [Beggiatoa sp. SS]